MCIRDRLLLRHDIFEKTFIRCLMRTVTPRTPLASTVAVASSGPFPGESAELQERLKVPLICCDRGVHSRQVMMLRMRVEDQVSNTANYVDSYWSNTTYIQICGTQPSYYLSQTVNCQPTTTTAVQTRADRQQLSLPDWLSLSLYRPLS